MYSPYDGIQKRRVNLPPRFADHASSCLPTSAPGLFQCTLPSQALSHLHSLAQSMYIATFLPKHVIPTCFADYVTSTSGAIRLAFDLSPWPQVMDTLQERVSGTDDLGGCGRISKAGRCKGVANGKNWGSGFDRCGHAAYDLNI